MILIKDGRVIDPKRGIDDVLDILIEGKKIKKIGKIDKKTGAVVLKGLKRDKPQKPMKRYKPKKK